MSRRDLGSHTATAVAMNGDWTQQLRDGDRVFVGSAAGEPIGLIDQLIAFQRDAGLDLTVFQLAHGSSGKLIDAASPSLKFVGVSGSAKNSEIARRGHGSYLLSTIWQTAQAIQEQSLRFDVALVQVAPPDSAGAYSLGISVDFARDAARSSRLVVAQVNSSFPRSRGDAALTADEIDVLVVDDRDLPVSAPLSAPDEQARAVARNVLDLVPNEATIEIGVGEIMTAILNDLRNHRDLALHTGLLVEPMVDLIQSGTITNRHSRHPDRASVANQATAAGRVVEFLNDNARVAMMPASYTHNPGVLGMLHRFRAINAAIEVDLMGRVNSEFVDGRRVATPGGLMDFVRAANQLDDGRSIIALRSMTNSGRPKVVSRLSSPGNSTVSADLADAVVTEYGVAELAGADARQRAERMIQIAHPSVRDILRSEVEETL